MRWFGESWGSHVCEHDVHAETPVGDKCVKCEEPIKEGDQGLLIPCLYLGDSPSDDLPPDAVYHIDCFIRSVFTQR